MKRQGINRELLKKIPPSMFACRNCGKSLVRRVGDSFEKIDKRRMYYCSNECRAEWYAKTSWPALRDKVLARDNWTCQECGREEGHIIGSEKCAWGNVPIRLFMEVHHIVPISAGGTEFDPANCVTLCEKCHKKKTKCLAKRRHMSKNQTELPTI